jgi:hypothetical protein
VQLQTETTRVIYTFDSGMGSGRVVIAAREKEVGVCGRCSSYKCNPFWQIVISIEVYDVS